MPEKALADLIEAYKGEVKWLIGKAENCGTHELAQAAEFLERAEGLQGFVDAYERLTAQKLQRTQEFPPP